MYVVLYISVNSINTLIRCTSNINFCLLCVCACVHCSCVSACVCEYACMWDRERKREIAHVERSENILQELLLSFHSMNLEDQTQFVCSVASVFTHWAVSRVPQRNFNRVRPSLYLKITSQSLCHMKRRACGRDCHPLKWETWTRVGPANEA